MYCICNTDDCNNKNACDCSTCKHPELSCPVFERKRIEVPDAVTLEIGQYLLVTYKIDFLLPNCDCFFKILK